MIKIGIVGTGGIAEWHASAFKENKNSEVVAACDVNKDRLNEFCDKYIEDCKKSGETSNLHPMLKKILVRY